MYSVRRVGYAALGVEMVGFLATPAPPGGGTAVPGVLLLHEGGGQSNHVRERAERLAAGGIVAFALDYLGGGTQHPPEFVQKRIGHLWQSPAEVAALGRAGYDVLVGQPGVDQGRVAAVGFCFGGLMGLELAREVPTLRAAIGLHPGIAAARIEASSRIEASVLMMCGAEDPVTTAADRARFEAEMRDAGVADWRLEVYGGVGHSFTNPDLGQRMNRPGFAYDARADRRSWRSTLDLLDEVLGSAAHAGEDRRAGDVSSVEDNCGR